MVGFMWSHQVPLVVYSATGCYETPHWLHRLHWPPKTGIFWALKQDCFRCTFSQCASVWISWIDRWHTDSQQCSELRLQTTPAKATGSWQDYHNFEAPLLTMLLVLASQALTDWTRRFDPFLYWIDLYLGPVWTMWPVRYFVTPSAAWRTACSWLSWLAGTPAMAQLQ